LGLGFGGLGFKVHNSKIIKAAKYQNSLNKQNPEPLNPQTPQPKGIGFNTQQTSKSQNPNTLTSKQQNP
jgi:hypothetical protein